MQIDITDKVSVVNYFWLFHHFVQKTNKQKNQPWRSFGHFMWGVLVSASWIHIVIISELTCFKQLQGEFWELFSLPSADVAVSTAGSKQPLQHENGSKLLRLHGENPSKMYDVYVGKLTN